MGDGGIQDVAVSWLIDAPWTKAFKHTSDVVQDYVSLVLIGIGTICLSVRILTTMGTGDLMCMVIGVENTTQIGNVLPYATGGQLGMIGARGYAQTDERCINQVLTPFMVYLPFIMIFQVLFLVILEKGTLKIPRIAQIVERFHKNIVEESLSGRDPEEAEDMYDTKTSIDAILKRRQRNEICVSLKRSSVLLNTYIGRNVIEVLLVMIYLPLNISQIATAHENDSSCKINIEEFPEAGIMEEGVLYFQCRGRKMNFYLIALHAHNFMMVVYGLCSFYSIIWCLFFRSVSKLLKGVYGFTKGKLQLGSSIKEGFDFLFLFDLLAHSFGLEATLRVLTHSDEKFYEICTPRIVEHGDEHLTIEEDKIKIVWHPAPIEKWLLLGKETKKTQKEIVIESYEVTIFPSESVKNTVTVSAQMNQEESLYAAWFHDLQGGRTEYVITVACQIGKSRMKGAKFVTNLAPYGPERPRNGMTKRVETNEVEIFWDPPKGDFSKYTLSVDEIPVQAIHDTFDPSPRRPLAPLTEVCPSLTVEQPIDHELRAPSECSAEFSARASGEGDMLGIFFSKETVRKLENLSAKFTTYCILGLEPSTAYAIELGTKTGNTETRQKIRDIIMTRPSPVKGLRVSGISSESATVNWLAVRNEPCLKSFHIELLTADGAIDRSLSVNVPIVSMNHRSRTTRIMLKKLTAGTDYEVVIKAMACYGDMETMSDRKTLSFTTAVEDPAL